MVSQNDRAAKRVALFVWGDLRLGGAERRFFRLFKYLVEKGDDVYLYTSERGAAGCEALGICLDRTNVRIFPDAARTGSRPAVHLAVIRRVLRLVKRVRKDGIRHLHFGENPGAISFLYGLLAKFACPFSVSLVDSVRDYQRSARERLYVVAAARFSTCIDCLSAQIKADLVAFLGNRYEEKCLVAPCSFTDLKAAGSSDAAASGARDIDVAMIARMVAGKGHRLLSNALIELERTRPSGLVVYICGFGPLEPEIRQDFQVLKRHQVKLYFESDPFRVLRRTKIYVSLQDTENYPSQSLLEAMACGCAVVATDVGSTKSLLDESCAILVPRDAVALAEALAQLLEEEPLRGGLGRNARHIATSTHTIERFAAYFVQDVVQGAT